MSDWRNDGVWRNLTPSQRLALMGLLERDGGDYASGINTIHANINRARALDWDTDRVLNFKGRGRDGTPNRYGWFQPLDEPGQRARADALLKHPDFALYDAEAQAAINGFVPDRVGGATHYLSKPGTMLALEAREPGKYKSWRSWTGFDPATREYRNQTAVDRSHAFLAPEGLAPEGVGKLPELSLIAPDGSNGDPERMMYTSANGFLPPPARRPEPSPAMAAPAPAAPKAPAWEAPYAVASEPRAKPAEGPGKKLNAFDGPDFQQSKGPGLVDFTQFFKQQPQWVPINGR